MALKKTKEKDLVEQGNGVGSDANESSLNEMNVEACNESDRYANIAERAYYKAEARGFESGYEIQDWLDAEAEFEK